MWPIIINPNIMILALVLHPYLDFSIENPITVIRSTTTGIHSRQSLNSLLNTHLLSNAQHRISTSISIRLILFLGNITIIFHPLLFHFKMYEIIKLIGRGYSSFYAEPTEMSSWPKTHKTTLLK